MAEMEDLRFWQISSLHLMHCILSPRMTKTFACWHSPSPPWTQASAHVQIIYLIIGKSLRKKSERKRVVSPDHIINLYCQFQALALAGCWWTSLGHNTESLPQLHIYIHIYIYGFRERWKRSQTIWLASMNQGIVMSNRQASGKEAERWEEQSSKDHFQINNSWV